MSKFKNSNNVYYTKMLFIDWGGPTDIALYTTQEEDRFVDGKHYPSVYRLFLSCGDPTGYKFANEYLGSWHHYELLMKATWFREIVDKAIAELEVRIKSEALVGVIKESKDKASKSAFQAQKFLLEKGWVPKDSTVGRPTKAKIAEEANKIVAEMDELDEIAGRVLPN